ncbi:hypothetical protein VB264_21990 [Arcicella aquatica]|uniref:Uncharacterized protein n=1 Tax=Arcicella aquatica TaxID=217141 RepID=A0ABU5QUU9_9BACT|nr:hypothetical protein [Arcicella aquatica]MEA5260484.1 hypothetical protein [Arcicella aquatica]
MRSTDIFAILSIYLVLSVVVICVLINRKIYYFFKIEQSRQNREKPTGLKSFFWEHNLDTVDKTIYLFTFPRQNPDDSPLTIMYIKIHAWVARILIFIILTDVLLMIF